MNLKDYEIEYLLKDNPEALRLIADYHEVQLTMADAIGDFPHCVTFHTNRKAELLAEAERIENEW